ncbi:MAG: hypothetical protein Q4F60_01530, partial [Candidatus Saccharibacteria bacterium]|nr:hypothetical protein [Candidatus Saccharibacteria bacterium]
SSPIVIPADNSPIIIASNPSTSPDPSSLAEAIQSASSNLPSPEIIASASSENPYANFDFEAFHASDVFADDPAPTSSAPIRSYTPTGGEIISEIERYKSEIDSAPTRPSDRQARSDYYDRIIAYLGTLTDSGDAIPMIETHYRNNLEESFEDFYRFVWDTVSIVINNIGL